MGISCKYTRKGIWLRTREPSCVSRKQIREEETSAHYAQTRQDPNNARNERSIFFPRILCFTAPCHSPPSRGGSHMRRSMSMPPIKQTTRSHILLERECQKRPGFERTRCTRNARTPAETRLLQPAWGDFPERILSQIGKCSNKKNE